MEVEALELGGGAGSRQLECIFGWNAHGPQGTQNIASRCRALGGSGSWGQWRDGLTGDRTVPLSETFSQMENKRWAGINERKTMAFHCQS